MCLIQGTVEALNGVHNFIAEKVREMPQSAQKSEPVSILQPQTTVNPDRVKQVQNTLTVNPVATHKNPHELCGLPPPMLVNHSFSTSSEWHAVRVSVMSSR